MKIKCLIKYDEEYTPYRCRKLRYKECQIYEELELTKVSPKDLKLAFIDKSYDGRGKIFYYDGHFWCRQPWSHIEPVELTALKRGYYNNCSAYNSRYDEFSNKDNSYEAVVKRTQQNLDEYLLVGRTVYQRIDEPRYEIVTFGLGHNHGGTGLFCTYQYNPNLSKDVYFNANQGKEAVAEANRIAKARGDTNDVGKFKPFIKVYTPELVKCDPQKEHGDGDPFLNALYKVTEGADSAFEAGILAIATAEAFIKN